MSTFDRDAVIEQAAKAIDVYEGRSHNYGLDAALPVIVNAVLEPIGALHQEWVEFMDDPGVTNAERAGVRMCAGELARAIAEIKAVTR